MPESLLVVLRLLFLLVCYEELKIWDLYLTISSSYFFFFLTVNPCGNGGHMQGTLSWMFPGL